MADPVYNIPGNKIFVVVDDHGQILDLAIGEQRISEFVFAVPAFIGIFSTNPIGAGMKFTQNFSEYHIHTIDLFRAIEASRAISTEKKFALERLLTQQNFGPFDTIKVSKNGLPQDLPDGAIFDGTSMFRRVESGGGIKMLKLMYYVDP